MGKTLHPENAAATLVAHVNALKREKAYIASVYRDYEGLKSLDDALAEAGVLELVHAVTAEVTDHGA